MAGCHTARAPSAGKRGTTMTQPSHVDVHSAVVPEPRLEVSLTNQTGTAITMYEHGLPWKGAYSMIVIAARADAVGTILERTLPIDDPGPTTITIQPGQVLTGSISLPERFPGFLDALRERDVIVFWSYQITPVGSAAPPRAGGYLLFPRQGVAGSSP